MKNWLTSLSKHELNAWIKIMSSGVNLFLAASEDKKNLEIARQILAAKQETNLQNKKQIYKTRNTKVG